MKDQVQSEEVIALISQSENKDIPRHRGCGQSENSDLLVGFFKARRRDPLVVLLLASSKMYESPQNMQVFLTYRCKPLSQEPLRMFSWPSRGVVSMHSAVFPGEGSQSICSPAVTAGECDDSAHRTQRPSNSGLFYAHFPRERALLPCDCGAG